MVHITCLVWLVTFALMPSRHAAHYCCCRCCGDWGISTTSTTYIETSNPKTSSSIGKRQPRNVCRGCPTSIACVRFLSRYCCASSMYKRFGFRRRCCWRYVRSVTLQFECTETKQKSECDASKAVGGLCFEYSEGQSAGRCDRRCSSLLCVGPRHSPAEGWCLTKLTVNLVSALPWMASVLFFSFLTPPNLTIVLVLPPRVCVCVCCSNGEVKLSDFGIARELQGEMVRSPRTKNAQPTLYVPYLEIPQSDSYVFLFSGARNVLKQMCSH